MGCNFLYPTFSNGGPDTSFQASAPIDEDLRHRSDWSYNRRGLRTHLDRNHWASLWPRGGMLSGDPAQPMGLLGDCLESGGVYFELPSCIGYGSQKTKFIRGFARNSADAPVANAIVQGFVTATDEFVGEVTADDGGGYAVGTDRSAAVAHYLVAYKVGSPDIAGTTVNTLLPTD